MTEAYLRKSAHVTTFEITGISLGDGINEENDDVITQFRYSENGGGDLYIDKDSLVHLIRTTEGATVHAVSLSGERTKVVVVTPSDPSRDPFLRTVGDKRSGNDLLSLPRF